MIVLSLPNFCGVLEVVAIIFLQEIWIYFRSKSLKVSVWILPAAEGVDI